MWLFTRYGMYSVVLSKENPEIFMVRARVKEHLLALKKRFGLPKQPSVLTTKSADYRYRLLVSKETWVGIAAELAKDIDYNNFKDQIREDLAYHRAATEVWGVMWGLQEKLS